jgi:hypothetical protein
LSLSDRNFGSVILRTIIESIHLLSFDSVIRLVLILIYTILIYGFGFVIKLHLNEPTLTLTDKTKKEGLELESMIPLISLAMLFASFLGLQLSYLVGGKDYVASIESTFAEFAKRGFFELLVVGICVFTLILVWEQILYQSKYLRSKKFATVCVIIILESVIMLGSAWSKLSLYIGGYGQTNLRLFTQVWIVCMGLSLLLLVAKLVSKLSANNLAHGVFWIFICGLIVLNLLRPDTYIAKQNLVQKNWDNTGISSYGYDGLREIKPLIESKEYQSKLPQDSYCHLKNQLAFIKNMYPKTTWFERNPVLDNAAQELNNVNLVERNDVMCYTKM